MKTPTPARVAAAVLVTALALLSLSACSSPALLKIRTPAVQAQIIGDVEKDILAGGGALLISGGSTSAAVTAMTAQELKNLPALQQVLAAQPTPKNPASAVTP
ncbi:hypothetical protein [Prosthecobacter fluviatilis]|uniref:Uncharacterized protein n=1 Tax=Prosthecobacter fluviatilis TaxID=445931 RepID=A0ABW0KXA1_9BACT